MSRRVCVVGAGSWGRNHIRTLRDLGALGGIVECDLHVLAELRETYPDVATYDAVRDAVADGYDGYTVATPAQTHFEIADYLIGAGQHLLVEKPLAMTVEEARRLADAARARGVNLMAGHLLLFHPAIRCIKSLLDAGKVGKVQYIYSNRLNLGTVRTKENILWSFAPHDVSIFQHFLGSYPTEVVSRGGAFLQSHLHDTTMTLLRYPDNVVGHVFVSWLHPFKEHRWVVIGSKGMLSYEDSSPEKNVYFYEKGIDWIQGEPIKRDGPTEVIPYEGDLPLTEELRYFVEHLDGTPVTIADGDNAVQVLEILDAATESLREHEPVRPAAAAEPAPDYFVHETSCVDDGARVGAGTKIWHYSHVQGGAVIGRDCTLGQNVNVGGNVRIGDGVKIQNNVSVYEGVELEDYVFCGPSMVFTNVLDPRSKYPQRGSEHCRPTLVREGASLGANCTIVCETTIGRHAFVAAGAVVTRDVPDYALMMGVPARRAGWVCECGQRLDDEITTEAACARCDRRYVLDGERLAEAGPAAPAPQVEVVRGAGATARGGAPA